MLDTGLFGVREKIFPVNGALANVRHVAAEFNGLAHRSLVSTRSGGVLHPVFYVNEREAAGIFVEISERILAGDADPAEIQFHGDEFGIRFGEEEIIREFAVEREGGIEFERMIVIAELDASFLAGFAGAIEEIRRTLPAAGLGTLLLVYPRTNDVAVADNLGGFEGLRPLFFDDVVARMARRRSQAILVENGADVFRRTAVVAGVGRKNAGEFDFLVADGGDFRDAAFEVGFHGFAHGVELETDAVNAMRGRRAADGMCGVRSPGWLGGGCESSGDGSADKCASIHGRHFTPSEREGNRGLVKKEGRYGFAGPPFLASCLVRSRSASRTACGAARERWSNARSPSCRAL